MTFDAVGGAPAFTPTSMTFVVSFDRTSAAVGFGFYTYPNALGGTSTNSPNFFAPIRGIGANDDSAKRFGEPTCTAGGGIATHTRWI